jgi:hypothetical protein
MDVELTRVAKAKKSADAKSVKAAEAKKAAKAE